jgi:predicted ATP-grasp superfamily ATP-dependent carboligase
VVFLGEAQPPAGKYAFCRQLAAHARQLGVERVITFAAMATDMRLGRPRVFAAATDPGGLAELKRLGPVALEDGHIGGLNGVLLAASAEAGLRGACLLGEMPHVLARLPYPAASQAILYVFTRLAGVELDLAELAERAREVERQLAGLLDGEEDVPGEQPDAEEEYVPEPAEEERLGAADRARIERLFAEAARDRSKAFELKQELDGLGAFADYEDRFLDLFKKPG